MDCSEMQSIKGKHIGKDKATQNQCYRILLLRGPNVRCISEVFEEGTVELSLQQREIEINVFKNAKENKINVKVLRDQAKSWG